MYYDFKGSFNTFDSLTDRRTAGSKAKRTVVAHCSKKIYKTFNFSFREVSKLHNALIEQMILNSKSVIV